MQRDGFDVVLGNPPWEVMQLSEEEYFASRKPEIADLKGATRKRAIAALEQSEPQIFAEFASDKRSSEAGNEFMRASERFALSARGKVNTYALFAELFANLTGERAGVIVPTGIATDATTAPFFAHLVEQRRLARLVDFENSAPLFAGVHRSFKFALLTLGRGEPISHFAFFLTQPGQLAEAERNFTLSPQQIAAINPNTNTAPVFRSRKDAELTSKIYSNAPVLINESAGKDGNPWGVEFRQGLFNMTSDSGLFRTAAPLGADGFIREDTDFVRGPTRYVPLYEAKMIHQFDHRWAGYDTSGETSSDLTAAEKADPGFEPAPRYWVPGTEVESRLKAKGWDKGWLMGWRDIARATDERTVIASVFPRVGVGHVLPLFFLKATSELWATFQSSLSSMALDFVARQKVGGTHLTYGYLKQFPILPPTFYTEPRLAFITVRVLELTYTSHSLAPFARDLGYDGPPFAWDEDRRAQLRADLDAFYTRAYGLTRDDLRYILDPADAMGEDYPSETFRVLRDKEIKAHGEYRTRRLVLEAWDRMEADGTFVELGLTDVVATPAAQPIQLPPLGQLPDAVWAWQQGADERDRVRTQLRAMIGILPEASNIRRVRLATLACLQPSLLDGFLLETDRREWQRLVAHATGVTQLVPPTNGAWGAAFNELVSSAALDVSPDGSSWAAGGRLDRSTLTSDDPAVGRALFAWSRLQEVDLEQGLTQVSAEIIPFIREGQLAA